MTLWRSAYGMGSDVTILVQRRSRNYVKLGYRRIIQQSVVYPIDESLCVYSYVHWKHILNASVLLGVSIIKCTFYKDKTLLLFFTFVCEWHSGGEGSIPNTEILKVNHWFP